MLMMLIDDWDISQAAAFAIYAQPPSGDALQWTGSRRFSTLLQRILGRHAAVPEKTVVREWG